MHYHRGAEHGCTQAGVALEEAERDSGLGTDFRLLTQRTHWEERMTKAGGRQSSKNAGPKSCTNGRGLLTTATLEDA